MSDLFSRLVRIFFKPEQKAEGSTTMAVFVGLFAAFGGILYGYDTGTISGVLAMDYVLDHFPEDLPGAHAFSSNENSLIVSILSAGTFAGSLLAPLINDTIGRRWSLIFACTIIFNIGIILQTAATDINLLVGGRAVAGFGVGILSSCVPLYQAETAPKWIRGAVTSAYQWAITIGLLLAACVNQGTHNMSNSGSYRIPIGLQFLWSIILSVGMFLLPETPRFFVHKGKHDKAMESLSRLRRLPADHPALVDELGEIVANYEYEKSHGSSGWLGCFSRENNQLKKIITGTGLQALQQLTGINFIFYFGTTFFKNSGIQNEFLITLATNIVNVGSTVPGILLVELVGRRTLLLVGAAGMAVSELLVAIIGTASPDSSAANKCLVAFVCIFIAFFAATWGPLCWVVTGEIFPLRTRAKSIAISTASNWLFNFAIAYSTPYLVSETGKSAHLGSKVFFIWGGCNFLAFFFAYYFVYETKGLSLEQIDELYETVPNAWSSYKFTPSDHAFSRKVAGDEVYDNKADENRHEGLLVDDKSSGAETSA